MNAWSLSLNGSTTWTSTMRESLDADDWVTRSQSEGVPKATRLLSQSTNAGARMTPNARRGSDGVPRHRRNELRLQGVAAPTQPGNGLQRGANRKDETDWS